jgi:hypothetical protein
MELRCAQKEVPLGTREFVGIGRFSSETGPRKKGMGAVFLVRLGRGLCEQSGPRPRHDSGLG